MVNPQVREPAQPPPALLVLYDGACPLCRREIGLYRGLASEAPVCFADVSDAAVPLASALPPGTTREQLLARFHVRAADGRLLSGAQAFLALWSLLPGWRWLAAAGRLPGAPWLLERCYRFFLRARPTLQRVAARLDAPTRHEQPGRRRAFGAGQGGSMKTDELDPSPSLSPSGPSAWAWRLGMGGLVPFVGLAAALWLTAPGDAATMGFALLGYGATIASFLGAIHWGLVMRDGTVPSALSLLWGVVPSLLAWLALLLGPPLGLWLIAALLWACLAVDRVLYPGHRLRTWLPLRCWLTVVASLACLAGAAALLR